ncbi:EAL domain-containing protein [Vibrio sp. DW001]|uniref:bifunctional diguanylate cyclase/phosphodiesterase n=1 Tax=Vibrio sp. DW001 TaxID=2912315 RepID=UPI0023B14F4D|nr:EAL domain-containing protein [Vibrio sp. DW001]WED28650.1 EAL domain-containing protein [Vibrio sp. DW001]
MFDRKIAIIVLSSACMLCLAAVFTLFTIKSSFENHLADSLKVIRDTTHQAIMIWAFENEQRSKMLASDSFILTQTEQLLQQRAHNLSLIGDPIQQEIRAYLYPFVKLHNLRGFFIIDPNNVSLASTRDVNTDTENLLVRQPGFLDRIWQGETLISLPQFSDVALPGIDGEYVVDYPTMFVASGIRNRENKIIAILALRLDPMTHLQTLVNRGQIGQSGETYLIDKSGYLLTQSRFAKQIMAYKPDLVSKQSVQNLKAVVPTKLEVSKNGLLLLTKMASSVVKGENGWDTNGYKDYRGIPVVGAWLWNDRYQFGLTTELDRIEAYLPFNQTKQGFIFFTGSALVLFVFVAIVFSKLFSKLRSREIKYSSLFENAGDPLLISDCNTGLVVSCNQLASEFLQYPTSELQGMHLSQLRTESTYNDVLDDINDVVTLGSKRIETIYQTKSGKLIHVESNAKLVSFGKEKAILSIIRDMTAQKEYEENLRVLANTDALTNLGNRVAFNTQISHKIIETSTDKNNLALIIVDIDEFRIINDALGHRFGDEILKKVAKILSNSIPLKARAFRFASDEFIVAVPVVDRKETEQICDAIQRSVLEPFVEGNNRTQISFSIGVALSPQDGADVTTLLQSADTALHTAKQQGRNRYVHFTEEMKHKDALHVAISSSLDVAIANNEFTLVFQPVVTSVDGQLVGAEALLRWESADMGNIRPDVFIPIAEHNGKILDIGQWVLNEACRVRAHWLTEGLVDMKISINVSPIQILSSNMPQLVQDALSKHRLKPEHIAIEITEGVFLGHHDKQIEQLCKLREMGVSLYLDDFGTGYSSLSYVHKYPFDIIKLDKSFVQDIKSNPMSRTLAKSVILMATSLDIEVIAEGVETQWQDNYLRNQGCHRIQGYFYGKPIESAEFLEKWNASADQITLKLKKGHN